MKIGNTPFREQKQTVTIAAKAKEFTVKRTKVMVWKSIFKENVTMKNLRNRLSQKEQEFTAITIPTQCLQQPLGYRK